MIVVNSHYETIQVQALHDIEHQLYETNQRRIMYQCPTGGGKSRICAEIAHKWPGRIFWLTHRQELIKQSSSWMQKFGRHDATVMSPIRLWNHWIKHESIEPVETDLLIIDEAHHATASSWERIIKWWPGKILGVTATPWRLSKKEGFDHLFKILIPGPKVSDLVATNYLSPCKVMVPPPEYRIQGFGNNAGDYSESKTYEGNSQLIMVEVGINWFVQSGAKRCIAYACGVNHANKLKDYAKSLGIPSAIILGSTPKVKRNDAMAKYSEGKINLLINVMVVTEGVDVPETDAVLLLRPTKSLALYLQMVGRAMRPGKEYATILDAPGLSFSFGIPEQDREWSLEARGQNDPAGDGGDFVHQCACGYVNHVMQKFCIGCGAQRYEICDRCSKPVFFHKGTECERCAPPQATTGHQYEDPHHPLAPGSDIPICSPTKIKNGPYIDQWGLSGPEGVNLKSMMKVEVRTRSGKKWRTEVVELVESAPWGETWTTSRNKPVYPEDVVPTSTSTNQPAVSHEELTGGIY